MSRAVPVIRFLFTLATVVLVLGGVVLVAAQAVALVLGRGAWLDVVSAHVGPPALISASVAGLLAFALNYQRDDPADAASAEEEFHPRQDGGESARAA